MEITLEIPESIVQALRLPRRGTKNELMRLLAITLYERGILGIGKSRELAGLTKLEFFAMLKNEGIAINYSEEEVKADLAALEALPE
jgi:predicted HTH domain antitoxin